MSRSNTTSTVEESPMIKACSGEPVERVPVWFMRQAGRYNPRHRELYEEHGVRGITTTPELNAEVTCLPVEDLGVDAAVMYADIMLPLEDMGIEFHYGEGDTGPILETEITSLEDVEELRVLEPKRGVPYILEAVKRVKDELPGNIPVIGFAGGPFSLSAYIIEGEASRTYPKTKKFMHNRPDAYHRLMELLTDSIVTYLKAKASAGADCLQLFESWMGALSPKDYDDFVRPYVGRIYREFNELSTPTLFFGTSTAGMLDLQKASGADVLGVDWRVSLGTVADRIGTDRPIMGNLDPAFVLGPTNRMKEETRSILKAGRQFDGHIFNLGHRVPNDASVDRLKELVDFVHEQSTTLQTS
ncbi:MAG: uroporphyrinogen decarboxylase [bacterium]